MSYLIFSTTKKYALLTIIVYIIFTSGQIQRRDPSLDLDLGVRRLGPCVPKPNSFVEMTAHDGRTDRLRCDQVIATGPGELCLNAYTKKKNKRFYNNNTGRRVYLFIYYLNIQRVKAFLQKPFIHIYIPVVLNRFLFTAHYTSQVFAAHLCI
jgi:hypothetical protein